MTYEQTLVQRIYEIMKGLLAAKSSGRLRKVIVRCDSMESVSIAKLNTCWQEIALEPIFQASHIELHNDPPFGQCNLCNQEFELDEDTARCPHCHHEQFKILHETPTIETYEME
ncbi:MAG: hydrogenase/urease maturation nickel metallochaperone HypA [Phycisphaerae bacterium]